MRIADPLRLPGSAVEAITDACLAGYSVSPRVLWGNVASAAHSAAVLVGTSRTDLAGPARSAADRLLADDRVEGGTLRSEPGFRRRSCCLIYRLSGSTAAVCGDCVLGTG
jgi:ferric iron reductase protein FhuF